VDIELTSGDFVGKSLGQIYAFLLDSTSISGVALEISPFATYAASSNQTIYAQVAGVVMPFATIIKINTDVISLAWGASGAATGTVGLRQIAVIG
jgi:hypothetical protein